MTSIANFRKFVEVTQKDGWVKAIKISFQRLFPEFIPNKNFWGLGYAFECELIKRLPPNPIFKHYVRSKITRTSKLQLGCGNTICEGWLHQDWKRLKGVDFVIDVRRLNKYVEANSLDAIFTSHMIEHLRRHEARELLADVWNWLRPGKEIWIATVNLDVLYPLAKDPNTSEADREFALNLIASSPPGHVSAWFFEDIYRILDSIGFEDIRTWGEPPKEFKQTSGFWDYCLAGKLISLNVYARKKI